jgi:hypothetical protein
MQSAMKCHKVTMQISSGVCQGAYMTGLCGADKKQVRPWLAADNNAPWLQKNMHENAEVAF